MQNNSTMQKIVRTNKPRVSAKEAAAYTGKQWKREDKRNRFSQV